MSFTALVNKVGCFQSDGCALGSWPVLQRFSCSLEDATMLHSVSIPFALSPVQCYVLFSSFFQQHLCLFFFFFFMKSSAISCFLATILYPFLPVPLPTTPNPQFFLSMVLSLSLVIMVQITGSGEAPRLGRGGDQTLQAGLCQQGRQPAAAD